MNRHLVILGTSGNASDVLDLVDAINARKPTWIVAGFLDDGREAGSVHLGHLVLGPLPHAANLKNCVFVNAIGSDRSFRRRPALVAATGLSGESFVTLVHPLASVSSRAQIGRGVCIHYGVSVASEVTIGDHCWLGPCSVIGHDATIGEHSIVAPAAVLSGSVRVGRGCYVGAGAVIRQHVSVADGGLLGIGAVAVRDVAREATVVGNPARLLARAAEVSA